MSDIDGDYGGDLKQNYKNKCSRAWVSDLEMFKPDSNHRRCMSGGHGQPRFDDEVWSCERPSTTRSAEFDPEWVRLHRVRDYNGQEYARDLRREKFQKEVPIIA